MLLAGTWTPAHERPSVMTLIILTMFVLAALEYMHDSQDARRYWAFCAVFGAAAFGWYVFGQYE
jgi:hypothetical protein